MGTPEWAIPSLQAVLDSGSEISAVFTQPDRPVGRKRVLTTSSIKQFAQNQKLPVHTPPKSGKSGNTGIGEIINSGTDYSMCLWTNFTAVFFRYSQDRLFQSAFFFVAEIAWGLSSSGGNCFRT